MLFFIYRHKHLSVKSVINYTMKKPSTSLAIAACLLLLITSCEKNESDLNSVLSSSGIEREMKVNKGTPIVTPTSFTIINNLSSAYLENTNHINLSSNTDYQYFNSVTDGNIILTLPEPMATYSSSFGRDNNWLETPGPNLLYKLTRVPVTFVLSKPVKTFGFEYLGVSHRDEFYDVTVKFFNGDKLVGNITVPISAVSRKVTLFAASTSDVFTKVVLGSELELIVGHIRYQEAAEMDIDPKSCPNIFSLNSKGVLPVSIFGSADLDVNNIDLSTIKLNGIAAIVSQSKNMEKAAGKNKSNCSVTASDNFNDLTINFDPEMIARSLGNVSDGQSVELTLTFSTKSGIKFGATDYITVDKKK